MEKIKNKTPFYVLLFLTVTLSWGFCFIVLDNLVAKHNLPVMFMMAARFVVATLFVGVARLVLRRPKLTKKDLAIGCSTGLVMFTAFLSQSYAASFTTPAKTGMLTGTYVVLVPIIYMIMKRQLNVKSLVDAVLCVGGFVVLYEIYNNLTSFNLGDGLALLGAVLFATQFILLDRNAGKIDAVNYAFLQVATTATLSVLLSSILDIPKLPAVTGWGGVAGGIAWLGVMGAGYAYIVQNYVQSKLPATTVSVVSCSESVFAVAFSLILGIEKPALNLLIGALIIFASIMSANLLTREKIQQIIAGYMKRRDFSMMLKTKPGLTYIGVDDKELDLFESQYSVPKGMCYNSYLLADDKVAVFDTVDRRCVERWLKNLNRALGGRAIDYLVVSHMEPDHSAGIDRLAALYPQMKIVGNKRTFTLIQNFTSVGDLSERFVEAFENSPLSLGGLSLDFVMAPMLHWPEVMMTYVPEIKTVFTADVFGKFGTFSAAEEWLPEARRYYFNIVGKYGNMVAPVLKKLKALDVDVLCPLHGPMLSGDLKQYIDAYALWGSYLPECPDALTVACASIHGNTRAACEKFMAEYKGEVEFFDLTRCDMSQALASAFKNGKLLLASSTYNAGLFSPMSDFIERLVGKALQNKVVAIIENGSWSPAAAALIRDALKGQKNVVFCDTAVTIRSTLKPDSAEAISRLCAELYAK